MTPYIFSTGTIARVGGGPRPRSQGRFGIAGIRTQTGSDVCSVVTNCATPAPHSHDTLLQVGARFICEESVSVRYHTLSDSLVFKFEESKSVAAMANLKNHESNVF